MRHGPAGDMLESEQRRVRRLWRFVVGASWNEAREGL